MRHNSKSIKEYIDKMTWWIHEKIPLCYIYPKHVDFYICISVCIILAINWGKKMTFNFRFLMYVIFNPCVNFWKNNNKKKSADMYFFAHNYTHTVRGTHVHTHTHKPWRGEQYINEAARREAVNKKISHSLALPGWINGNLYVAIQIYIFFSSWFITNHQRKTDTP